MKEKHVREIRAFNRFYTGIIGLLDKYIYNSRYSLPEVRILYEIYHQENITATDIIAELRIDKGYLSRVLQQFEKKKLVAKKRSRSDGRAAYLVLTAAGRKEFESLDDAASTQIMEILEKLSDKECSALVEHMTALRQILSKTL